MRTIHGIPMMVPFKRVNPTTGGTDFSSSYFVENMPKHKNGHALKSEIDTTPLS